MGITKTLAIEAMSKEENERPLTWDEEVEYNNERNDSFPFYVTSAEQEILSRLTKYAKDTGVSFSDLLEYYDKRYLQDKKKELDAVGYLQTLIENNDPEEEFRHEHMRLASDTLQSYLRQRRPPNDYQIADKAYNTSRELLLKFENKNFKEKK